jgi:hypothetical protein
LDRFGAFDIAIGTTHPTEARLSVSMILSAQDAEWFMRRSNEKTPVTRGNSSRRSEEK